ncbi:MAG: hypothetical protein AAF466_00500, partial [Bacteroidota bacterium]
APCMEDGGCRNHSVEIGAAIGVHCIGEYKVGPSSVAHLYPQLVPRWPRSTLQPGNRFYLAGRHCPG